MSVWLKGAGAVLELMSGAALLAVSPGWIMNAVWSLTAPEMSEPAPSPVAHYLRHQATHLSLGSEHYAALYLIAHGVVKLALVWGLLARALIAYPLSIVVFGAFIAYQLHRFTHTRSPALLVLTGFDLLVIALVYLEYRALRRTA